MSARPVLLLTRDDELEKLLKEAFLESAATILLARSVDDALQIVCTRGAELDLGSTGSAPSTRVSTNCPLWW